MSITFRGVEYSDKGGLQEMAATLSHIKGEIETVMLAIPSEVDAGTGQLEQAIELVGRVESDLDDAAEMV